MLHSTAVKRILACGLALWVLRCWLWPSVASPIEVVNAPCLVDDENGVEARAVALIDRSTRTLHAALYELALPSVAMSLVRARLRGVDVCLHMETDNRTAAREKGSLDILRGAAIPITWDDRPTLMHNKFMVADDCAVFTGSANLTWPGCHLHHNEALFICDRALAARYEAEFQRLYRRRAEAAETAAPMVVGGMRVQVAFGAGFDRETLYLGAVRRARQSIRIAAFSLTHEGLVAALEERLRGGVSVEVMLDSGLAHGRAARAIAARLQADGAIVLVGDERPTRDLILRFALPPRQDVKIHHKLMLVDDRCVVTGSANLSKNGLDRNDENILEMESTAMAARYHDILGGVESTCRAWRWEPTAREREEGAAAQDAE